MRRLDKAVPYWVNYGAGRLFSDPDEAQPSDRLPKPSPSKKPDKRVKFPDDVMVAHFTQMHAQMNRSRCKTIAKTIEEHGLPTYEGVKNGTSAVRTQDLSSIWTNHRVQLLRSGKRLQQVIATMPGLWMRHLARPIDGLAEMRQAFEHDTEFDPGPEGFDKILAHVMEQIGKVT